MTELSETISTTLKDLNTEQITDEVIGFWLEEGENSSEIFANVVFLMKSLENSNSYNANSVDDACTLVSERLSKMVTYTHCWFRTAEEFKQDFSNVVSLKEAS